MSVLKEENGVYAIDVTNATWATDQVHELYHKSGIQLNDVDFLIECKDEAKLIAGFDVLSIKEWNENELYGKYPIVLVENN